MALLFWASASQRLTAQSLLHSLTSANSCLNTHAHWIVVV